MKTNELMNVFHPARDGGEIHEYASPYAAGYIDRTFEPGEQPYPLDDEGQVTSLVNAGAVDRRDE